MLSRRERQNLVFKTINGSSADNVYFEYVQRQKTVAILASKFNREVSLAAASMTPASTDSENMKLPIRVVPACVVTLPERQGLCGVLEPFLSGDWHDASAPGRNRYAYWPTPQKCINICTRSCLVHTISAIYIPNLLRLRLVNPTAGALRWIGVD